MDILQKFLDGTARGRSREEIATLLKSNPDALARFEESYRSMALEATEPEGNIFGKNSRDMSEEAHSQPLPKDFDMQRVRDIVDAAVDELLEKTWVLHCVSGKTESSRIPIGPARAPLTNADLQEVPTAVRPQLTGSLMRVDIRGVSYEPLLEGYQRWKTGKTEKERMHAYHMFRQGLDILDLDPVTYEMLSMNPNAMSHWLPGISYAAEKHGFFNIPETKIAKVPITLLQLTRLDYKSLTPATLKIVDDWAMRAFGLDVNKTYFIKTGTYSSKFDFRNAKVTGEEEVRTLGEYLLFIHHQALQMASPLSMPCIYGVSTTNEWVVREFIEDEEGNPCIYKGLPLHTEYRVFVDFDNGTVLGVNPYWDPDVMLKKFLEGFDRSAHDKHDYVIYKSHEGTLMARYHANVDRVVSHVEELLQDAGLTGQWSIDIMQNGDKFWLIDMATAETSALRECVPVERIRHQPENWLPDMSQIPLLGQSL